MWCNPTPQADKAERQGGGDSCDCQRCGGHGFQTRVTQGKDSNRWSLRSHPHQTNCFFKVLWLFETNHFWTEIKQTWPNESKSIYIFPSQQKRRAGDGIWRGRRVDMDFAFCLPVPEWLQLWHWVPVTASAPVARHPTLTAVSECGYVSEWVCVWVCVSVLNMTGMTNANILKHTHSCR